MLRSWIVVIAVGALASVSCKSDKSKSSDGDQTKDGDKMIKGGAEPTGAIPKAAVGDPGAMPARPADPGPGEGADNDKRENADDKPDYAMAEQLRASGDGEFEIDRDALARFKDEPDLLAKAATVTPARENGEMVGFTLKKIAGDSPLAQVGLTDGDLVTKIGAVELRDPKALLEALQKAQDDEQITIEYRRGGDSKKVTITVAN